VDDQPIAEWLPERYRNVLDRISELETSGRHAEADRVRRDAIRAYARSWTPNTVRRLDALALRADHLLRTAPARRAAHHPGLLTLALVSMWAPRRVVARIRPGRPTPPSPIAPASGS
jgi:hypothetical protein